MLKKTKKQLNRIKYDFYSCGYMLTKILAFLVSVVTFLYVLVKKNYDVKNIRMLGYSIKNSVYCNTLTNFMCN